MEENKTEEFIAVGRRKSASARVRIKKGTGVLNLNGTIKERLELSDAVASILYQPLKIAELEGTLDLKVLVRGGGEIGQAQAISLGIARALEKMDENLRAPLKKAGLLTRDSRSKERKKPGQAGARKRFQFSKR